MGPPAAVHDRRQKGIARHRFAPEGDDVAGELPGFPSPEDLFFPHQGPLAGGELEHGAVGVPDQLVSDVSVRRVSRNPHLGPHPEGVDLGSPKDHILDLVLVEPAAGKDLHVGIPLAVQDGPDIPAQLGHVPAVQADSPELVALPSHLPRHLDGLPGSDQGVVSVDEQDGVLGKGLGKGGKGVLFVGEARDKGMGHGSEGRDAVPNSGQDIAGAGEPRQVARPGHGEAGVHPLGPSKGEIHQAPPLGGVHAPGRLGGDAHR